MSNRPDFMIIGAMKCATSTLHEQLVKVPGLFMTTPKEPNFFSDDEQYRKGMQWYESLYESSNGRINGESSTHYTKLPTYPLTIERIKIAALESSRFIYIVRDPIDRLVSHYMHEWSQGNISVDINEAIECYPELIAYSCYSYQLEAFLKQIGSPSIMVVFFDSLKSEPQKNFRKVLDFIGYEGVAYWNEELKAQNVSSQRIKKFPFYDTLIDSTFFRTIRRALVPKKIRANLKERLTMKQRPDLSPDVLSRLHEVFNKDLIKLSNLLGVELTCENFKSKACSELPVMLKLEK